MAEINPELLQILMQQLGHRVTPEMVHGAMLAKGMEGYSRALTPKQPQGAPMEGQAPIPGPPAVPSGPQGPQAQPAQPQRPPRPQAGGQIAINKQVSGPGPLRSGTTQEQLMALASLLASPAILQQLARLPYTRPNMPSAPAGLPGVPGPTIQI